MLVVSNISTGTKRRAEPEPDFVETGLVDGLPLKPDTSPQSMPLSRFGDRFILRSEYPVSKMALYRVTVCWANILISLKKKQTGYDCALGHVLVQKFVVSEL